MSQSTDQLRITVHERVEVLLAEQRRRWHAGLPRAVEQLLAEQPALAAHDEATVDLIYQEFVLRSEFGPPPTPEEYFRRFPRHRVQLEAQLKFLQAVQVLAAKMTQTPTRSASRSVSEEWAGVEGFEVFEELGRGSMGVVYRARQNSLGRLVALKVIHPTRAREPAAQARFRQEAAAVARLQDPHIVQIHDVGEQDGRLYFAMELVEGITLERCLASSPLSDRQAAQLVQTLARTMQHAHDRGIVHRDLKPANVLLQAKGCPSVGFGEPKITDFGLARCREDSGRLTETGAILGTPSYMAPEQAAGGGRLVGPASDVYALGAILYECLTGRPPFQAATPLETLRQAASDDPLAPSRLQPGISRNLDTICLKCLEKEPVRRYASARELADDLGRHLRGEPIQARPVGVLERSWRWCRRNPNLAGMAVLLALVVLSGLAGMLHEWRQVAAARSAAETSDAQTQELLGEFIEADPAIPLRSTAFEGSYRKEPLLKAEAQCEQLLQKRPGDLSLRMALTRVRGGLAHVYAQHGQLAEEEICLRQARDLWEPLVQQDPRPEYRAWLATTLTAQARFHHEIGHYVQCLKASLQAQALWDELFDEQPANLWYLQRASENHVTLFVMATFRASAEAVRRPLKEQQALVRAQAAASPADRRLFRRLAVLCCLLGELHSSNSATADAAASYTEAAELYRRSLAAKEDRLLDTLDLAHCCFQRMDGRPADAHYAEAIACFERAGAQLIRLAEQHPEAGWLQGILMKTQLSLALCHWRAGQTARAEAVIQSQRQRLTQLAQMPSVDATVKMGLAMQWLAASSSLSLSGQRKTALALTREIAALNRRLADLPWRDLEFSLGLAGLMLNTSAALRQEGDAAEALRQAELARRLAEGLCQAVPDSPGYRLQLSGALTSLGKAHWELGHPEEAVAAFGEAAAVCRLSFEQAPTMPANRQLLSRCYDRVAYWSAQAGKFATAAEALRQREKLWPDDSVMLRTEAKDFLELADLVGEGKSKRSAAEEIEQQRYFEESVRCERAAVAAERRSAP